MVNGEVTKVTKELSHTGTPLQTLAKADKLVITAERAEDGKLRCTCATWDDAVVVLKGEALDSGEHRATGTTASSAAHARPGTDPPVVTPERRGPDF